MQQTLPWVLASISLALLVAAAVLWLLQQRRPRSRPLPTEWTLTARPVFSSDERRVYRQLREALPHHIVLSKLPLVRFSQPTDPSEVRFWYQLLGSLNVTFAICSANGRVLAAIDLDNERGDSRRAMQIKQSVLAACRVRYLRCPVDHLPSVAELQLMVPQTGGAAARGPHPAPTAPPPRGFMVHPGGRDGASAPRCGRTRASCRTPSSVSRAAGPMACPAPSATCGRACRCARCPTRPTTWAVSSSTPPWRRSGTE